MGVLVPPIVLYLVLKINAVGLNAKPTTAPIDYLSLTGRLYTDPSIVLFYITKFIFPWKLATAYYWVYPTFSIRHVLIPLIIDLAVVWAIVYSTYLLKRKTTKAQHYTFLFFAAWAMVGILPCLRLIGKNVLVFRSVSPC